MPNEVCDRLPDGAHIKVSECRLRVTDEPWCFAIQNQAAIIGHWAQRLEHTPTFFNGRVHIMLRHSVTDDTFMADYARTDFASFLYWRDHGFGDPTVNDGFGSAVLRSSDGAMLLGVQGPGNLNSGRAYCPGGFIDVKDVGADNFIDIDASITREVTEETGLDAALWARTPGYLIARSGALIAIAVEWCSALDAVNLAAVVRQHLRSEPDAELNDVTMIASFADAMAAPTPGYVRVLARALLPRH